MLRLFVIGLSRLISALPLTFALALGRRLGWVFDYVIRYHRRDAIEALRFSLPEKTAAERRQILKRMYLNLGMTLIEELRMSRVTDQYMRDHVSWENESYARDILKVGKGVLVLSAHMGNWDLLCSIAPHFNYPVTIITKNIKNKGINEFWMESRRRFGLKFVPAHNSYRQCLAALRRNEIVGFILDQNMIWQEGIFVEFFGRLACTTPGLAFMAAQSGAAVLPVFMLRQPNGRHLVKVFPPLAPPPDRKPETILAYTQLYTKTIEDMVRQYPDQWIWIHRRWHTTTSEPDMPEGMKIPPRTGNQQSA
jgi:KDO2-lipid IV(A) lauroyltransferase